MRATKHRRRQLAEKSGDTPVNPLAAFFDTPGQHPNPRKHTCEACATTVPAVEKDWQMHIAGFRHQIQAANPAAVTEQHLQHFGCPNLERLSQLQCDSIPAILQSMESGYCLREMDQLLSHIPHKWAVVAMKLNEAVSNDKKELNLDFSPGEVLCLSDILQDRQPLKSLHLQGTQSRIYEMHVADAVTLDKLLKSLCCQKQLQSLQIMLASPEGGFWDHEEDDVDDLIESDSLGNETMIPGAFLRHVNKFVPLWEAIRQLIPQLPCLRHVAIMLPHKSEAAIRPTALGLIREANKACQQRMTAVLMGTHSRLGCRSDLRLLPPQILKEIIQLSLHKQPCTVEVYSQQGGQPYKFGCNSL